MSKPLERWPAARPEPGTPGLTETVLRQTAERYRQMAQACRVGGFEKLMFTPIELNESIARVLDTLADSAGRRQR